MFLSHFMPDFKTLFTLLALCLLVISCSPSRQVQSSLADQQLQVQGLVSQWPIPDQQRVQTEYLDYYITNNEEFLFLRVDFKNRRLFDEANRFGFTVYFDNKEKVKRSFGLTYPTGVIMQLGEIPGVQREYFENPGWEGNPQNRNLLESLERNMSGQAMLMQRNDRRAAIRPAPISLSQLQAQGIDLELDQSSRNMSIAFKIPLQSSRFHQFALDTQPGQAFNLGFEVKAPTLDEIDPNKDISDDARRRIAYQLPSAYEHWVRVTLADAPR